MKTTSVGYPNFKVLIMMREDGFMHSDLVAADKADKKIDQSLIENSHKFTCNRREKSLLFFIS